MFAIVTTTREDKLGGHSVVTVYDEPSLRVLHTRQVFEPWQTPEPLAPAAPLDDFTLDHLTFWHLIDGALSPGGWRSDPMRQRRHIRHGGCIEFAVVRRS